MNNKSGINFILYGCQRNQSQKLSLWSPNFSADKLSYIGQQKRASIGLPRVSLKICLLHRTN